MKGRLSRSFWHKYGRTVIIYVFLAALMVFVSIFNKDFFTLGNFKNLLHSSFPSSMVALKQMLITLTGGINLFLGGIVTLYDVACVMSMDPGSARGLVPTLGAAAAAGLTCGAVNGVPITKGRLTPIIITIVITAAFDGTALLLIPNLGGNVYKAFAEFLTRGYSGAVPFLLFILILCLVRGLTNGTSYGKASRATGGSENVAYSTGIQVGKIELCIRCLAGFLCAVAGIFLSAQMNSADATIGKNYAMNAITVAVVGGTAMTGVVGDPLGTITSVFIISVISNILNLFDVSPFYQFICQGLILIAALPLSAPHKRH